MAVRHKRQSKQIAGECVQEEENVAREGKAGTVKKREMGMSGEGGREEKSNKCIANIARYLFCRWSGRKGPERSTPSTVSSSLRPRYGVFFKRVRQTKCVHSRRRPMPGHRNGRSVSEIRITNLAFISDFVQTVAAQVTAEASQFASASQSLLCAASAE